MKGHDAARATAERVARESYGKLMAFLSVRSGDVAGAEDALAEAFAAALASWPDTGVPEKPEAWLLTTARRRIVDFARRAKTRADAQTHLTLLMDERDTANDAELPDERLALMFACSHPAIDEALRAPLILQTVLGFDAEAIASAFLISPAAMRQRLVRAKAKIRDAGIPFQVPAREDLGVRLEAVLEAVYAAYAEGWSDPVGSDPARRNLAEEAIWLGRLLVWLLPAEAEARGLLALMLFTEARRAARRDADGNFVPLHRQDAALWNAELLDEAEALLHHAAQSNSIGRYQLEAAIQSAHSARRSGSATDWAAITALYDALYAFTGSPVVAINRAIAIAETRGPEIGLAHLDAISGERGIEGYQPYWAARAELLSRLARIDEAEGAFAQAIGLESDAAVRRFLQEKQSRLRARMSGPATPG